MHCTACALNVRRIILFVGGGRGTRLTVEGFWGGILGGGILVWGLIQKGRGRKACRFRESGLGGVCGTVRDLWYCMQEGR